MTTREQCYVFLLQYIKAAQIAPWVADMSIERARSCLHSIGGMMGNWNSKESDCFFYQSKP